MNPAPHRPTSTQQTSPQQTTPRRRTTRLKVLLLGATMVLGACGSDVTLAVPRIEAQLSPALANRDADMVPELLILEPANGATVSSPVMVKAELRNLDLAPKGRVRDGEGHLHVLIDRPCVETSTVIPSDEHHVHVGTGANHVEVELAPGEHRLCVQIGDGFHSAALIQDEITVFVANTTQSDG